jgi:hypothetical protein
MGLLFFLLATHLTPVGEEQELPQGVQRLALVDLGVDPPTELLALQVGCPVCAVFLC